MSSYHLILVSILLSLESALSCTFCIYEQRMTLAQEIKMAKSVFFAKAWNQKTVSIDSVFKKHSLIQGGRNLAIDSCLSVGKEYLIFVDVYKNRQGQERIDPYRGIQIQDAGGVQKYLEGVRSLEGKSAPERLKFYFNYLPHSEDFIASDAYHNFAMTDYKDMKAVAKAFDAKLLRKWLEDPKTPPVHHGLYAVLLGHSGGPKDAEFLRRGIDGHSLTGNSSTVHGVFTGYLFLQPKEAWAYFAEKLENKDELFRDRYNILRMMRFLHDERGDLIPQDDVVQAMAAGLNQSDIADFVIEDFRRWQRWEQTSEVLKLFDAKKGLPIIQRSVLRFALQSTSPEAKSFLAKAREDHRVLITEMEEYIREFEEPPPKNKSEARSDTRRDPRDAFSTAVCQAYSKSKNATHFIKGSLNH